MLLHKLILTLFLSEYADSKWELAYGCKFFDMSCAELDSDTIWTDPFIYV